MNCGSCPACCLELSFNDPEPEPVTDYADDPNWHVCRRCCDRFYAFSDWDFCIPCMETKRYELDDRL